MIQNNSKIFSVLPANICLGYVIINTLAVRIEKICYYYNVISFIVNVVLNIWLFPCISGATLMHHKFPSYSHVYIKHFATFNLATGTDLYIPSHFINSANNKNGKMHFISQDVLLMTPETDLIPSHFINSACHMYACMGPMSHLLK